MVEAEQQLVKRLKALADGKRLLIVEMLSQRSVCVCEMEELVKLTQPAVSHHLRILREAGLITDERRGQWIFYSLHRENYDAMLATLAALPAALSSGNEATAPEVCGTCEQLQK